ncbi:TetR/AcrR family transcriptional regulator [Sphingomonas sp. KC8]|nr:TetR/AcrR family transcriptional regulator [Sphingomonas sp. KC8]ARS28259.1 TetR family transcriptional regulator [Sphingomonas sp. KC8]
MDINRRAGLLAKPRRRTASVPFMTAEIDRQTRILDAAERRFLVDGFERCSVESIANDARASKREIYRDWKSKSDLFIAVANRIFADADVDLLAARPENREMRPTLVFLARHLFDLFVTDRNRDLFRASVVAIRHFPDLASDIHSKRLTAWAQFGGYFEELIAGNKIQVAGAYAAANRFGSLCVEGSRYLLGYPAPAEPIRAMQSAKMVDLFLNGYRVSAADPLADPIGQDQQAAHAATSPVTRPPVQTRMSPHKQAAMFDALLREFLEKGYHRANMAIVATAVGASKSTIYRQFGSKEGGFEQLVMRRVQQLAEAEPFALIPGETLESALARLCRNILDRHLTPDNIAIVRALIEESRTFPELGRKYYDSALMLSVRALRMVLHHYDVAEPDDPTVRAFHVLATYGSRFIAFPTPPNDDERAALSDEATAIFLHGVAVSQESSQ